MGKFIRFSLPSLLMAVVGCQYCCRHEETSCCGASGRVLEKPAAREAPKELPKTPSAALPGSRESLAPCAPSKPATVVPVPEPYSQKQNNNLGPIIQTNTAAEAPAELPKMEGVVRHDPREVVISDPPKTGPGLAAKPQAVVPNPAGAPELARLAEAWPSLPDAIRRAMLALEPEFSNNLSRIVEAWPKLPQEVRRAMLILQPEGNTDFKTELGRITESWPRQSEPIRRAMLALEPEFSNNLALVNDTWPRMPEEIRRAMLALLASK